MILERSFKIAVNILIHSKLRSWLTIIGIVIGIAAIVAIISIGNGFQKSFQDQVGSLGADLIYVTLGFDRANACPGPHCSERPGETSSSVSSDPFTTKELQALKSIPEIAYVTPLLVGTEAVSYMGGTADISLQGVDGSTWQYLTTDTLSEGRFLQSGDSASIVIGNGVAHDLFKEDIPLNRDITIGSKTFRVVGILEKSGGFSSDDQKIFMPLNQAQDVLGKDPNTYDAFIIKAKDDDSVDGALVAIEEKFLLVRHKSEDTKDFTVLSMKTILDTVSQILTGFTFFLGTIAAVSLLVGAVGIANTMFTAVLERTKEIGIMKALGAKQSDILLIFLINSGLVGLIGGVLGVLIGGGIALLIPYLGISFVQGGETLQTSVSLGLIIFSLLFSIILGMLSGIIPAYRASKLQPIEALRGS